MIQPKCPNTRCPSYRQSPRCHLDIYLFCENYERYLVKPKSIETLSLTLTEQAEEQLQRNHSHLYRWLSSGLGQNWRGL